jgi:exodeoxyribonuclease V alpha subunit
MASATATITLDDLDELQKQAVDLICTAPIGIVTGGPGRGKTTVLKFALDRMHKDGVRYKLAAPTGKAAKRMHEATGYPAQTIHRLLEFHPVFGFQRKDFDDTDVVIIDESSMLDIELAAALLGAIGSRTRFIMIGDADQLPPVGPGRLFGDLCDANKVPVVRLLKLHRSAEFSWIARNAPRILVGEVPELEMTDDFRFVDVPDATKILPTVRDYLTSVFGKLIMADPQVLIPQRTGLAGIDACNLLLQAALNPRREGQKYFVREHFELRIGDRVIQTKNDYSLHVFNGEVGTVADIVDGRLSVDFEGRGIVEYTFDQAYGLQLAYGLTVHRAQGSEFAWVVVVCHSTHSFMLTRQLIYTAVTRGKQGVVLIGDKPGLKYALADRKPPKRNTSLIERMDGTLEA